jgi:hypothetical protein
MNRPVNLSFVSLEAPKDEVQQRQKAAPALALPPPSNARSFERNAGMTRREGHAPSGA